MSYKLYTMVIEYLILLPHVWTHWHNFRGWHEVFRSIDGLGNLFWLDLAILIAFTHCTTFLPWLAWRCLEDWRGISCKPWEWVYSPHLEHILYLLYIVVFLQGRMLGLWPKLLALYMVWEPMVYFVDGILVHGIDTLLAYKGELSPHL